ncbi:MAG: homoserine kinase [Candidatus Cloacimonadota bacterium]|nr:MAG: homoserine kinase [Candidatus Cloacimonadota bacterium]
MRPSKWIKVSAPASIGNVGVGFDVLGLAIKQPRDEVWLRQSTSLGVNIIEIEGDDGLLPLDDKKNTAGIAINFLLEIYFQQTNQKIGVELKLIKNMPLKSGLGSSGASAAAAVFALQHLLNCFTIDQQLEACLFAETRVSGRHADNVAPSLLGGLCIIQSMSPLKVLSIPVDFNLPIAVIHPDIKISTKESRNQIPARVSMVDCVNNLSKVASLVYAISSKDPVLFARSLNDMIIEKYRAPNIAGYSDIKDKLMEDADVGVAISGSGPSILIAARDTMHLVRQVHKVKAHYEELNIELNVYLKGVDSKGACLVE